MPTFEEMRQAADNRNLVRKIQKAVMFLGPGGTALPPSLFDGSATSLIDLNGLGFWPVGLVTADGYTFTREMEKEDVFAMGYASPSRSDTTVVPRTIAFSAYENAKRHMLELKYGTDLSGITQDPVTGEIVFDEPDLPVGAEYCALVIGTDGPATAQWVMGRGYGTVKLATTGEEVWGGEGGLSNAYTLDVFSDETTGSPVKHYIGGTGAVAASTALGFSPPAAWAATTSYAVGDRVTLTGGEVLRATVAGTSGSTEPTAPAIGATVVDGSVTWERES